jgi:ATP-binding cassette, sub-family E, member 1
MSISKKRIAVINYDKCNPEKCGNYFCEHVCPVNRTGKECIVHKDIQKPVISEELCIGCNICENKCPFEAINIININFELDKPIHSFGENMFRLHGLPLPKDKSVVGLIGRNGIGKTTAIKILSGNILPNFGKKISKKENVLDYYKGKEALSFFEKLYTSPSIAIKPQNIEGIKVKGTIRDLLSKVDDEKKLEKVAEQLNITSLLDRDASSLSGGEFQKIAIAATGLKKADLYFFDEPTSFLDIKERLRVAKFIQELTKNSSVIVIEHDLILLDYLSDYVHLMYGKPSVFGFVSQVKTTREGINTYLEGYSKDENYRFREYSIDFFSHQYNEKNSNGEKLISWPEIEKTLGNFKLKIKENTVNRNEVIGVLGPNGIGKTTFMKILAGEIKPDNTQLNTRVKISYKPQYISYTGKKTVRELFDSKTFEKTKRELIKPLEIEPLLEKKIETLSGGELQRVSIAFCLSKEADIYLLDEPSAYLDVEQRINVAKIIKNIMDIRDCSSIIIDHDLTFIDYLSDKLMVFLGTSAINGIAKGPFSKKDGMNLLLSNLEITVRRDKETKRPRINKFGSVLDMEQKKKGNYYYT